MDREYFEQLCDEDKEVVFHDMAQLFNLLVDYPLIYKDLKIFAEWHEKTGLHLQNLKKYLDRSWNNRIRR